MIATTPSLSKNPLTSEDEETDLEKLRREQLAEVESAYNANAVDEQWAAVKAKYTSKPYVSSDEYYEYAALKQQYELARSGYVTERQSAIDQINQYYDLVGTMEGQGVEYGASLDGILDDQGRITDVSKLKDILPQAQEYQKTLLKYQTMLSTVPAGESEAAKEQRLQQLQQINTAIEGITSLSDIQAKQEEYAKKPWFVKGWEGSKEAFLNIYSPAEGRPAIASRILPFLTTPISVPMGGLAAVAPRQLDWWQRHIDAPWGSYLYQSTIQPYQDIYGAIKEGRIPSLGTVVDFELGRITKLGEFRRVWTGERDTEYEERVPEWGQMLLAFTNPVYWVGPKVAAGALKGAVALPEAIRFAGRTTPLVETAGEFGRVAELSPQAVRLLEYSELGMKGGAIAERLPQVVALSRPYTYAAALAEPAALAARVALWSGGMVGKATGAYLEAFGKPVTWPLSKLAKEVNLPVAAQIMKINNRFKATAGLEDLRVAKVAEVDLRAPNASYVIKGTLEGRSVQVFARDLAEVRNYQQTGQLAPIESGWNRVYIDEFRLKTPGRDVVGRDYGTVMPQSIFRMFGGKIDESGGRTIYSFPESEGLITGNSGDLTIITQAQIDSGIKPAGVSAEVWARAKQGFETNAKYEALAIKGNMEYRVLGSSEELLRQVLPDDWLRHAAMYSANNVPGAKAVIGAINRSAMVQTSAEEACLVWLICKTRGLSDVSFQMARVYQWSLKEWGPFEVTWEKYAVTKGEQTVQMVRPIVKNLEVDEAKWAALPEQYRSRHVMDVCSFNPDSPATPFRLTEQQAEYIRSLHQVTDGFHELLAKEGISIPKTQLPDFWHYVPRIVAKGDPGQEFFASGWKGRIGQMGDITKPRGYGTALDGSAAGVDYGSPARGVSEYGNAAWKMIADQRLLEMIYPESMTPEQLVDLRFPSLKLRMQVVENKLRFLGGGMVEYRASGMKVRTEFGGVRQLVTDIAYREKVPTSRTLQAVTVRFPAIGQRLEQILHMPMPDAEAAFKAISKKTWDDVNREALRMQSATEQAVAAGRETVSRTAAAGRIGPHEFIEAVKDVQFERMFYGRARGEVTPGTSLEAGQAAARRAWFAKINPDVTMADIRAAAKRIRLNQEAETKLLESFYDRSGKWNVAYAKSSRKTMTAIKRLSEAEQRQVRKAIREAEKQRKESLKELLIDVDAETRLLREQATELRSKYNAALEAARRPQPKPGVPTVPINQPGAAGRLFTPETAQTIASFTRQKSNKFWTVSGEISGALRMAEASLDFSAPLTYGLPLLAINPAAWARATAEHVMTFIKPEHHQRWLVQHQEQVMEFTAKYGGTIGGSEFYEAMGTMQKMALRNTKMGPAYMSIKPFLDFPLDRLRGAYFRAERAFGSFGDIARLELWQALRPMATTEAELYAIAQMCDKMTGVQSTEGLGIGVTQRQIESSLLFFAPRYRRAGYALMTDFFRGGIRGTIARKALARLTAGGIALYIGTCLALGQEPQLDPTASNFLCIRISGRFFGIGSFVISTVKFLADLTATGAENPGDLLKWSRRNNPTIKYLYKQASPFTSSAVDLMTNKNFLGEELETPEDYARYLTGRITPMALDEMITKGNPLETGGVMGLVLGVGAGEAGMRVFEVPLQMRVREELDAVAPFAPDKTSEQLAIMKKRPLLWDDLLYSQQEALLKDNPDLKDLKLESEAQSIERGDAFTKLYAELEEEEQKAKDNRSEQTRIAVAEYQFNMALKKQMQGGATLTADEQYKAQNAGAMFREKMKTVNQDYQTRRDQLAEMARYADCFKAREEWSQQRGQGTQMMVKKAIDDYYTMLYEDVTLEDQYGNPLWKNIEVAKAAWADKYGGIYISSSGAYGGTIVLEALKEMQSRKDDLPAVVQEYYKAKEAMTPYWELTETLAAAGKYPKDAAEQHQWILQTMQAQNPTAARYYQQLVYLQTNNPRMYARISSDTSVRILLAWANSLKVPTVDSVLSQQRLDFRRQNPEVEAYGEMFYDWQPLSAQTTTQPVSEAAVGWRY